MQIRNVAIIAHVDHGKTTLVDGLLKQTQTFDTHEKEFNQSTILDSNELEREKGVTILAKNTAVTWKDYKINILDTPGHADFSGEVERVLNMADGCILLVDAAEGVLSQTRFVLSLALKLGLKAIVVINKVDRKDQRAKEVETEIGDLFLELATNENQLDFPILYASGIKGIAGFKLSETADHSLDITDSKNLIPLFETIVKHIPQPTGQADNALQIQVNSLDYDNHLGKIVVGRIFDGTIHQGQKIKLINHNHKKQFFEVEHLFIHQGLNKKEVNQAQAGEIISVSGISNPEIGDTITTADCDQLLPELSISEPTVKMTISVNTSPFSGRDAKFSTSRQIINRINQELETNVGLKIDKTSESGESVTIVGRGELHLAILIESMRREGYEFSLSRPEVVIKEINGQKHEPWESVIIEVPEDYTGFITASMSHRQAKLIDMKTLRKVVRFEYEIATSNLIGYRNDLLTKTSGQAILHSSFLDFEPKSEEEFFNRGGAIIAHETGNVTAYSLDKIQNKAKMMVNPGDEVYQGQVVGINNRQEDMVFNVVKGKKLTNMRAASADKTVTITPAWKPNLEQLITMIAPDEILEVTPKHLRLRKKQLTRK